MDAIDLLEQQHRDLMELFAGVMSSERAGRRTAAVAHLVRAIEAHSRVEESVFYAAFAERVGKGEGHLYDAYEDHALLRFAAVNLLRTRATDVRFAARLKLLHGLFQRHALIEEDWMFPKAKRAFHDEALDRIGAEIARAHASRLSVAPPMLERPPPRRRAERPAPLERRALLSKCRQGPARGFCTATVRERSRTRRRRAEATRILALQIRTLPTSFLTRKRPGDRSLTGRGAKARANPWRSVG